MRTLLVDNHDSFTHNLAHLIARHTGQAPLVMRNDAGEWHAGLLAEIDAVILSPGPGTPTRPGDFGFCAEILELLSGQTPQPSQQPPPSSARPPWPRPIPLLGVCLGHQGLAHHHGARIIHAPEPMHGRLSAIHHTGTDLFAGVPTPFHAVRYHSLAVTELPAELEATAWTADGVLMAVRHRELPQWGVQFHPGSIATEHAETLMRNFVQLAATARGGHRAVAGSHRTTSRSSSFAVAQSLPPHRAKPRTEAAGPDVAGQNKDRAAPSSSTTLAVHTRTLALPCSSSQVYDVLCGDQPEAIWLDAHLPELADGRFSIVGAPTGPRARIARADAAAGMVHIEGPGQERRSIRTDLFSWLREELRATTVTVPEIPCGFTLGWVGYLGYELGAACSTDISPAHPSDIPDAVLMFLDRAAVIDHHEQQMWLLALGTAPGPAAPDMGSGSEDDEAQRWLSDTAARLRAAATSSADSIPAADSPSPAEVARAGALEARHSREDYLRLVRASQRLISDGETYEVCLTNRLSMPLRDGACDPQQVYAHLRAANPTPFGALIRSHSVSVLSTSPERFIRIAADGRVESRPIKGTRPRGASTREDAAIRAELAEAEKDRAENLMIVDLVRHDLGGVAELGSVRVDSLCAVESYATVHQLVSTISAQLASGISPVDCVRAAFPPGSMTGAPKERTMRLLEELEGGPRGPYSGAIGYFSLSGAVDLSVAIRTVVMTPQRLDYGVGGAVVALSEPAAEYAETQVKAAPLLHLLGAEFPETTQRMEVPPTAGTLLAADSWLVSDGAVRALDHHRERFTAAVAAALAELLAHPHHTHLHARAASHEFWTAVMARIPKRGLWFPRVELRGPGAEPSVDSSIKPTSIAVDQANAQLAVSIRPAPPLGRTVQLWLPPQSDPRHSPLRKGPDLARLNSLRTQAQKSFGCEDVLLYDGAGRILETCTANLLWWEDQTLCVPDPDLGVFEGVTLALVLAEARRQQVPVQRVRATVERLSGREVWTCNALHGLRLVRGLLDAAGKKPCRPNPSETPRFRRWRAFLDELAEPH